MIFWVVEKLLSPELFTWRVKSCWVPNFYTTQSRRRRTARRSDGRHRLIDSCRTCTNGRQNSTLRSSSCWLVMLQRGYVTMILFNLSLLWFTPRCENWVWMKFMQRWCLWRSTIIRVDENAVGIDVVVVLPQRIVTRRCSVNTLPWWYRGGWWSRGVLLLGFAINADAVVLMIDVVSLSKSDSFTKTSYLYLLLTQLRPSEAHTKWSNAYFQLWLASGSRW